MIGKSKKIITGSTTCYNNIIIDIIYACVCYNCTPVLPRASMAKISYIHNIILKSLLLNVNIIEIIIIHDKVYISYTSPEIIM